MHSISENEEEQSGQLQKSIVVFAATHVAFAPPANPIYVPLHVGREGKKDLGYLSDNTGEHISDLNFLYGELTGLYWMWQNVTGVDYVGMCHYRRYFLNPMGVEMSRKEYLSLLSAYDVLVPKHQNCEGSYIEHYGRAHNRKDLEAVGRAIGRICPEYLESYEKAMEGTVFYSGNLFVTGIEIMRKYAKWLFEIFVEAGEEIDVSGYDAYHKRVYGFLSEQMLYIYMEKNGLSYYELPVGISEEKAETRALKESMAELIGAEKLQEAKALFQKTLAERPDLLLAGSDIHEELKLLYQILHLCETEEKAGCHSLLSYSRDVKKLAEHYRRILEILAKRKERKESDEDESYLKETAVSQVVLEEILRCTPSLRG